jgi:hypothetical protein
MEDQQIILVESIQDIAQEITQKMTIVDNLVRDIDNLCSDSDLDRDIERFNPDRDSQEISWACKKLYNELFDQVNRRYNMNIDPNDENIAEIIKDNDIRENLPKIVIHCNRKIYCFDEHYWARKSTPLSVYEILSKKMEKLEYTGEITELCKGSYNKEFENYVVFLCYILIPAICEDNSNAFKQFDSNRNLLGFLNGVYDTNSHTFRNGKPEDMILSPFDIEYLPNVNTGEIQKLIDKDFPEKDREKYMRLFFTMLHGIPKSTVYIFPWNDSRYNDTTMVEKYIDLFEKIFGYRVEYISAFNDYSSSLYTKEKGKYKRFKCTSGDFRGYFTFCISHPENGIEWLESRKDILDITEFEYKRGNDVLSCNEDIKFRIPFASFILKYSRERNWKI